MTCKKCELLNELFKRIEHSTNRDYWVMTELFVYLHDGKDYCRGEDGKNTTLLNLRLTEDNYAYIPCKKEFICKEKGLSCFEAERVMSGASSPEDEIQARDEPSPTEQPQLYLTEDLIAEDYETGGRLLGQRWIKYEHHEQIIAKLKQELAEQHTKGSKALTRAISQWGILKKQLAEKDKQINVSEDCWIPYIKRIQELEKELADYKAKVQDTLNNMGYKEIKGLKDMAGHDKYYWIQGYEYAEKQMNKELLGAGKGDKL